MTKKYLLPFFIFLILNLPLFSIELNLLDKKEIEIELDFRLGLINGYEFNQAYSIMDLSHSKVAITATLLKMFRCSLSLDLTMLYENIPELIQNAYVQFTPLDFFRIKAGQFKIPFGEAALLGPDDRQNILNNIITEELTPGRDRGILFYGRDIIDMLNYDVGVFHGNGIGNPEPDFFNLLLSGNLFIQKKLFKKINLKIGYNTIYEIEDPYTIFSQGLYGVLELNLPGPHSIYFLSEYIEKLKNSSTIENSYTWEYGFTEMLSYRLNIKKQDLGIEFAVSFDFFRDNNTVSEEILNYEAGAGFNFYFLDDCIRLKLWYNFHYDDSLTTPEHRIDSLIMVEV